MQILEPEHGFDEPLGLLSDCHRRIERFITILHKVATDAPEDGLPEIFREGLETALDYFIEAAPKHTLDEEESLFPRILSNPEASAIIAELESDHAQADPLHQTVEKIGRLWLNERRIDPVSRAEFRQTVETLLGLYAGHIETEDQRLFPLAGTILSAEALQEVGVEMAARRGLTYTA